jgi:acetoin:2,6-dichlorophenolindophenol oxidoreductase subunit beta
MMNQGALQNLSYGEAICSAFDYLLANYPEVFVIGQGLWSPWYVGNSMTGLDIKYGTHRIIDTPVSESACTGAAVGASLAGMRPIVVHPRMDFMLYAMDPIVNQAAKWSYMSGGQSHPAVTIRSIINRGGEQGAQHSQALHAWFSHVPGLRVVMPSTVADARDLLIASALSDDPVVYIDDRWLYDQRDDLPPIVEQDLSRCSPQLLRSGSDLTIVSSGYSSLLATNTADQLKLNGVSCDVVDLRILNPLDISLTLESVLKTRRLLVVDSGWKSSGFSAEVIASVVEAIPSSLLLNPPLRVTLPDAPAPTAANLEASYYPNESDLVQAAQHLLS